MDYRIMFILFCFAAILIQSTNEQLETAQELQGTLGGSISMPALLDEDELAGLIEWNYIGRDGQKAPIVTLYTTSPNEPLMYGNYSKRTSAFLNGSIILRNLEMSDEGIYERLTTGKRSTSEYFRLNMTGHLPGPSSISNNISGHYCNNTDDLVRKNLMCETYKCLEPTYKSGNNFQGGEAEFSEINIHMAWKVGFPLCAAFLFVLLSFLSWVALYCRSEWQILHVFLATTDVVSPILTIIGVGFWITEVTSDGSLACLSVILAAVALSLLINLRHIKSGSSAWCCKPHYCYILRVLHYLSTASGFIFFHLNNEKCWKSLKDIYIYSCVLPMSLFMHFLIIWILKRVQNQRAPKPVAALPFVHNEKMFSSQREIETRRRAGCGGRGEQLWKA
ncbi:uncharacterized protein [Lepisosteus oculatus]|uniref:uncharacterized protein isoform X3 n=1 Tax=Lepisosteus oculatus TaxID=7918 RepID=UPI00073FEB29|nr:PREDICTED: uncharacterized protein LOC107076984 isoform X1 [Lepisosteus oculatus]